MIHMEIHIEIQSSGGRLTVSELPSHGPVPRLRHLQVFHKMAPDGWRSHNRNATNDWMETMIFIDYQL